MTTGLAGIVTGSESQTLSFVDGTMHAQPSGLLHAVDRSAPRNQGGTLLGYALCGHAVLIWSEIAFDSDAGTSGIHDVCAALAAGHGNSA